MSVHSYFYQNPLTCYKEGYTNYGSFDEQTDQISKIISHNDRIVRLQDKYNTKRDEIKNAKNKDGSVKYKDFDHYKQDGSIWVDYLDRRTTTKDAAKEDIDELILQQNQAYIIGMITLSTILVTTFIVMRK
jgi:uncharacterized protein YdcH (DUF465 family)